MPTHKFKSLPNLKYYTQKVKTVLTITKLKLSAKPEQVYRDSSPDHLSQSYSGYTVVITDKNSNYRLFDSELIIVSLDSSTEGFLLTILN